MFFLAGNLLASYEVIIDYMEAGELQKVCCVSIIQLSCEVVNDTQNMFYFSLC